MNRNGWIMIVMFAIVSVSLCLLFMRQCSVQPGRKSDVNAETALLKDSQKVLRRTSEFLKPDTTSDLRFGRLKSSKINPSPSSTPQKP